MSVGMLSALTGGYMTYRGFRRRRQLEPTSVMVDLSEESALAEEPQADKDSART